MARKQPSRIGEYVTTTTMGETVRAYLPRPLPPDPPLDLPRLLAPIEKANQALGRLDGMTSILPSANLFVFMYVRKEALLSSQIEGTRAPSP
jgi:Fic family protein